MLTVDTQVASLERQFQSVFGRQSQFIAKAPGRINLIGEHTDYNDGFVLPIAINKEIQVVAALHDEPDYNVRVYSAQYQQEDYIALQKITRSEAMSWSNYLRAVLKAMIDSGNTITGFDVLIDGNIPQGAGLSSSAAYEVAVCTLINHAFQLNLPPEEIALLAQRAESEFVGVQCGIMDQFISTLAKRNSALLVDCRSLTYQAIPLNFEQYNLCFAITHSGVSRQLVNSAYNARRQDCQAGVQQLSHLLNRPLKALRDVTMKEFSSVAMNLNEAIAKRCRHVISENERVLKMVSALAKNDTQEIGSLLYASHSSLKDDFEVSCFELDKLIELSHGQPGILGARMTGAGFGGCTIAIMEQTALSDYQSKIIPEYERLTGKQAEVFVCTAASGASIILQ